MITLPKPVAAAKIQRIPLNNWLKGYTSSFDDDRKPVDGLKTAGNVVIEQNGTVRPRPSMVLYGTQPPGTVLGQIFPFVDNTSGTPLNWNIAVCNVSGTTNAYISKDGGAWTLCSGKTYDNVAKCHFEQVFNAVLIMNGCLTGDSLVLTKNGEKRIDSIGEGDRVWTPMGYKKVLAAGPTKRADKIVEITTNDGVLRCTPEHKIFTNRGVVKADNLLYTDSIWTHGTNLKELPSKGSVTNFRDDIIMLQASRQLAPYTGLFGRTLTALFQTITTFTTKMVTPTTTGLKTLSAFPNLSTCHTTPKPLGGSEVKRISTFSKRLGHLQKSGIDQTKEENGKARLPRSIGRIKSGLLQSVWNAVGNTIQHSPLEQSTATKIVQLRRLDVGTENPWVYDLTVEDHHCYLANGLLVSNSDNLSYLDIPSSTVIPFTSLTKPTITSVTATGLSASSNFTYYYRVSAINQGETAASVATTVTVSKTRDQWAGGTTEFVTVVWPRISGATRYAIYVGDTAGFEYYLDTVADVGSGSNMTYVDDSSLVLNTNRLAPEGDSTAGPKVTRATNVLGQVFMVGDKDNPYRVWFGGTGNAALDFSAFDGGGWVEIDKGGREFPVAIEGFRDGHGNPVATCFMKGTSGHGKLVHLSMTSTTLSDTVITFADVQEANGQDGTDAPDGVIYANDYLWYPSVNGFKNTGTQAQIQNILSTADFSDQILPDIQNLNVKKMDSCVGLQFNGRLYWSLPVGSDTNNQIWVLDLKRGQIWTNPWYVSADWLWLYDDNNGVTHFMALSGNQIYEFTYEVLTQDGANAFRTDIGSGMIKFSPDGEDWGSVIDVTFVVERPQGNISFSVVGKTLDQPINTVGNSSFVSNSTLVGWNESYWNRPQAYWDAIVTVPSVFGVAREEVTIEIGTELQWLTWGVSSDDAGVDYQLSEIYIRFVNIGPIGINA